jgi:hypothetical protein
LRSRSLSPEHKAAVLLGLKEGDDKVSKYLASGTKVINGWNISCVVRRPRFLQGRLAAACRRAKGGIYRQRRGRGDVSVHPTIAKATLDASKHNYTITFRQDSFRR